MGQVKVRLATEADAAAILAVYAPYIRDTVITFEYEVPSVEEFAGRIREISGEYPYLLCEIDGEVAAYAYGHRHMARAAYQWNAELSVYVDRKRIHRGVGRALYGALLELLQLQNIQTVYGIVTSPNENSERLHAAMGFVRRACFPKMGYKFGKWLDVAWFEKNLGAHSDAVEPFAGIRSLDPVQVERILENCARRIGETL